MLTWIKFSERQPEKEGEYICFFSSDEFVILRYRHVGVREGRWIFLDNQGDETQAPDYWAEINPPPKNYGSQNGTVFPRLTMAEFFDRFKKESPMPEKPLCKDCKWVLIDGHSHHWCSSQNDISLVTGEPRSLPCESARSGYCGSEGRWFEAKEEVVQIVTIAGNTIKGHAKVLRNLLAMAPSYRSAFTAGEWNALIDLLDQL